VVPGPAPPRGRAIRRGTLCKCKGAGPARDNGFTCGHITGQGADGRAGARLLDAVLPAGAVRVASDEPKAWQTLAPDGERGVIRDSRLGAVRRTEAFSDDFRRVRRQYVGGARIDNWEPRGACRRQIRCGRGRGLAGRG
jgi:hypothetical protein